MKKILISIFSPVFSGSTYFSMCLNACLLPKSSIFLGELNRLAIPGNVYRDYDTIFVSSKIRITARESILNKNPSFWRPDGKLNSIADSLDYVFNNYAVAIEDSKHADWHSYLHREIKQSSHDIDWINIVLFRDPFKWLSSFIKAVDISPSQALSEGYISQYIYYMDNMSLSGSKTYFIDFDSFSRFPENSIGRLLSLLGISMSRTAISELLGSIRIPDAIGGNLKSYSSCKDFPVFALNSPDKDIEKLKRMVNRFYSYESESHNLMYAESCIEEFEKVRKMSIAREPAPHLQRQRFASDSFKIKNPLLMKSLSLTLDCLRSESIL